MTMLYPVYIHTGDAKHAHGVTFPDFPGCFAAADEWGDLPEAIQEAVQAHFQGRALKPCQRPLHWKCLPPTRNSRVEYGCWPMLN
ncbi:type II toxin-antitoxin system HicB family antitoxin [Roseateles sp. GG27B]